MIKKDRNFKNKYVLTDDSTSYDLGNICRQYPFLNCLICNSKTASKFLPNPNSFAKPLPVTINNSIEDGVFYINGMY